MICTNLMWKPQHYECHHFSHSASILNSSHCLTVQCVGYFSRSVHLSTILYTHRLLSSQLAYSYSQLTHTRELEALTFNYHLFTISLSHFPDLKQISDPAFFLLLWNSFPGDFTFLCVALIGFTMYSYTC